MKKNVRIKMAVWVDFEFDTEKCSADDAIESAKYLVIRPNTHTIENGVQIKECEIKYTDPSYIS